MSEEGEIEPAKSEVCCCQVQVQLEEKAQCGGCHESGKRTFAYENH